MKELKTNNQLKKYKNPYACFMKLNYSIIKNNNVNMTQQEIIKEISNKWKNLSEEEKNKYKEISNKEKIEFMNLKTTYSYKYNKKIKIKKPKRFRTPFMFYLHENKKLINKNDSVSSLRKISDSWKSLKDSDKLYYINLSKEDKLRYTKDLIFYIKNKPTN